MEDRFHSSLLFKASIIMVLAIGVWLRCSSLDSQSLWADEGYTVWISHLPLKEIGRVLLRDTGPPLYYFFQHFWIYFFGDSETALRSLSAVFSALSLPLFYLVARRALVSRTAVLLATSLYSISFFQIWFAKEARFYAQLAFLSLGCIYTAILCLQRLSGSRLFAMAFFLAASLYTHNLAWFYLPGLFVFWFVYPSALEIRERVKGGLIVAGETLLLFLPWLPSFIAQARFVHHGGFWAPRPGPRDLLDSLCTLGGFDSLTFQELFRSHLHTARLFGFWTWAPAFFGVFFIAASLGLYSAQPENRRKTAALLAYALSPILLLALESRFFTPVYINRAFLGSCSLLPLVFCLPVAYQTGVPRRLFLPVTALFLIASVVSCFGYLRRERKEDWRGAMEYLQAHPDRPQIAVAIRDYGQLAASYYANRSDSPIEVSGLIFKLNPDSKAFESLNNKDQIANLAQIVGSGKYHEVDLVMEPSAPVVKGATAYLTSHCQAIEVQEFHWIELRRCFLQNPGK